jgi:hypothetical protein
VTYVLVSVASILGFGVAYYYARKLRRGSSLAEHLMLNNSDTESNVESEHHVWLAPVTPPVQFEPSHLAAIASSDESTSSGIGLLPSFFARRKDGNENKKDDNIWLAPVS